jgi:hypothetical protein
MILFSLTLSSLAAPTPAPLVAETGSTSGANIDSGARPRKLKYFIISEINYL